MALFSRLRGGTKVDTTIAKAVLTPAVLAMAADGSIDVAEIHQLSNLCSFSPIFAPLQGSQIESLIKEILGELQKQGAQPVIEGAVAKLSPGLRETAFCFAARIALADGVIDAAEQDALAGTATIMELPQESFDKILDVVVMLQRPATA